MTGLDGTVAVVTGASSGIGSATALALSAHGANVVIAARRQERLRELETKVSGPCLAVEADVTDRTAVEALFTAAMERFGRVDVLAANAGVFYPSPLSDIRVDEWVRMVDVNLKGLLYLLSGALPIMTAQGSGHVVAMGSLSGHRVRPGAVVYGGTKFAVRAILHGLRQELAGEGRIRISQVSPGVVDTEFLANIADPEYRREVEDRPYTPLTAQEVADAVLYIVSQPQNVTVGDIVLHPTGQVT